MEHLSRSDYFDKVTDIQDFLALNLNSDDPVRLESSSYLFYDQDLNFCFDDKPETKNLDRSPNLIAKRIQKARFDKKRYQNISNESRLDLIESVTKNKEKIKHAAERLGINYSSAKYIYQVYKKEGRKDKIIFKKKSRDHEVFDQTQNGGGYHSPVSNVFSAHPYSSPPKQEKEQSMLYNSNWMTPKPLSMDSVHEENLEILEIVTEKEKIDVPETDKCNQFNHSSHQENLLTTEIKQASQTENPIVSQGLLSDPSAQTNYPKVTHSTSNNMGFPTPAGYLQSYPVYNLNNMQNNPIPSQQFQIYPYLNHGLNQIHAVQVIPPSAYMPLQNHIPFPVNVQLPSMQPQICMPNHNGQFLHMNGFNQVLAMPVMVCFQENLQTATIDNVHNAKINTNIK